MNRKRYQSADMGSAGRAQIYPNAGGWSSGMTAKESTDA
jgi:hypothetical protein